MHAYTTLHNVCVNKLANKLAITVASRELSNEMKGST